MPTPLEAELEQALGAKPNSGDSTKFAIIDILINRPELKVKLATWLAAQGIPYKAAMAANVTSLATAYASSAYLAGWRRRVNPSFSLLNALDDNTVLPAQTAPTAPAQPPAANTLTPAQSEALLRDLFAQVDKAVNALVDQRLSTAKLELSADAKAQIKELASASAEAEIARRAKPQEITINREAADGTSNIILLGLQHQNFPKLLSACRARDHRGFRLNVWLTGPTGSGKTTAAENVAKALGLNFGSDGSLDADYKVLGFRDANGNIISTQFLDIYENGGIYVADEIDNWMPSALLSLNAALANGWCSAPKGMIKRHPDACIIACANTWGLGATNDYVGRTKLDAASLDRFQPKIDWPIDVKLERAVAENHGGNLALTWHNIIVFAREKAKAQGLKIIISPRATFGGIALLKSGFDLKETAEMTFLAGLSQDQIRSLALGHLLDAPLPQAAGGSFL